VVWGSKFWLSCLIFSWFSAVHPGIFLDNTIRSGHDQFFLILSTHYSLIILPFQTHRLSYWHYCLTNQKKVNMLLTYYWKVPGLGQKRDGGWTYSILVAISFNICVLWNVYSNPIFFHASKAPWKSLYLMLSSTACNFLWMSDIVSKRHHFSFIFNLGVSVEAGEW
jgi:hypothetical protein